jgi:hypothetical protein
MASAHRHIRGACLPKWKPMQMGPSTLNSSRAVAVVVITEERYSNGQLQTLGPLWPTMPFYRPSTTETGMFSSACTWRRCALSWSSWLKPVFRIWIRMDQHSIDVLDPDPPSQCRCGSWIQMPGKLVEKAIICSDWQYFNYKQTKIFYFTILNWRVQYKSSLILVGM